jgi:hypothetical protein
MITPASFPTPDLAIRSTDPDEIARARAFADKQAAAAESLRVRLAAELPPLPLGSRVTVLRNAHQDLIRWRYDLAVTEPRRLGLGAPQDAARFLMSAHEGGRNYDRIGRIGRLRAGATWNPETQTYQGGVETPASRIMVHYGHAALDRFATERPDSDVLLNVVSVDGGRLVPGNQLVRGAAALRLADELRERLVASGRDATRFDAGPDPMYVVSAEHDNADTLFGVALITLAGAVDEPEYDRRITAWQTARYGLYQASPRTKKGSDAVTRVFLVAVGAVLFGTAPVMEQDCDLRCMVFGQAAATEMPADISIYERPRPATDRSPTPGE